jgi:hypothetical protein
LPINSKKKGSRGELEFCHFIKEHGYPAERSVQYMGNVDAPDILSPLFEYFYPEVKRTEKTMFYEWHEKADEDAGSSPKVPIVFHRKNRGKWMAFIDAKNLLVLIQAFNQMVKEKECTIP